MAPVQPIETNEDPLAFTNVRDAVRLLLGRPELSADADEHVRVLNRLYQMPLADDGRSTVEQYALLIRFLKGMEALDPPTLDPELLEILMWAAEQHVLQTAEEKGTVLAELIGTHGVMHPKNTFRPVLEEMMNMQLDAKIDELLIEMGFLDVLLASMAENIFGDN